MVDFKIKSRRFSKIDKSNLENEIWFDLKVSEAKDFERNICLQIVITE